MPETVTVDAPEEEANLVDPGPNPLLGERAYRSLKDRFGPDFAAAHEEACRFSDELARLYDDEGVLTRPFDRRIERQDAVIARAEERVRKLKGARATLEANREAALKPNRTSRAWRLQRLDEFRRDYNERLRLKKNTRSLVLTGGRFEFTYHTADTKLLAPVGEDGRPIEGKTDEAALIEGLAILKRCGLHDAYEPLVVTKAKVALREVSSLLKLRDKKGNLLRKDGLPVIEVYVKADPDEDRDKAMIERVKAEGGTAWPNIDKATGEYLGWTVTLPAVQIIRSAEGVELTRRPLLREVPPAEEWTLDFVPNKPGEAPEEDETDAEG